MPIKNTKHNIYKVTVQNKQYLKIKPYLKRSKKKKTLHRSLLGGFLIQAPFTLVTPKPHDFH